MHVCQIRISMNIKETVKLTLGQVNHDAQTNVANLHPLQNAKPTSFLLNAKSKSYDISRVFNND